MTIQNTHRVVGGNPVNNIINPPSNNVVKDLQNMSTVVCHFHNEEHLLPWWLEHHKRIFDHGIMIDYHSTDRSMEIIREICPDWEIRYTRNKFFDSVPVDEEVMNIEKVLGGWRMALNVTEFLYGNVDRLGHFGEPTQFYIGNYVFVDMEDPSKGNTLLDHRHPLHKQRYWGYDEFRNTGEARATETMGRMSRSIHNYPITYPPGRHFGGDPDSISKCKPTFDDLAIFYYGWADLSFNGLKRKDQIKHKSTETGSVHNKTAEQFAEINRGLQGISRDLRAEIAPILEHNRRITGQEF